MPIVPMGPEHERFVYSSWCAGAGEPRQVLESLLERGARCLVLQGNKTIVLKGREGPLIAAWACAMPPPHQQVVVWVYTSATDGVARGKGYMRALLEALGVDVTQPMVALYDSPSCRGLIRKGWPITVAEKKEHAA